MEEAAREARYAFFLRVAKQHRIPRVALAHTLDDQAGIIDNRAGADLNRLVTVE